MSRFKNRFSTTPHRGNVRVYINGELKHIKDHYDRTMRENYCNQIFYEHSNLPMKFEFFNDDIELVILDYTPPSENTYRANRVVKNLPIYTKNGVEYFDADKFCKIYELGYTIPSGNYIPSLKF